MTGRTSKRPSSEVPVGAGVVLVFARGLKSGEVLELSGAGVTVGGVARTAVVDVLEVASGTYTESAQFRLNIGIDDIHWQATSEAKQVSKEHWKKQDLTASGQAVAVEVSNLPRAGASLVFKQVAQVAASDG